MRYSHPLEEWRIADVERKAEAAHSRLHEVSSLRSDVDRLEHSLREARSEIDGLRAQLETVQSALIELQQWRIDTLEGATK